MLTGVGDATEPCYKLGRETTHKTITATVGGYNYTLSVDDKDDADEERHIPVLRIPKKAKRPTGLQHFVRWSDGFCQFLQHRQHAGQPACSLAI